MKTKTAKDKTSKENSAKEKLAKEKKKEIEKETKLAKPVKQTAPPKQVNAAKLIKEVEPAKAAKIAKAAKPGVEEARHTGAKVEEKINQSTGPSMPVSSTAPQETAKIKKGPITLFVENRVPTKIRTNLKNMLDYSGEETAPEVWIASNLIIAFLTSFILALMPFLLPELFVNYVPEGYFPVLSLLIFIIVALVFVTIAYIALYFKMDARRKRVQDVLPDFLSAVSMNINAGMEPLSALYVSLRPDFDPITTEMKKIRSLALGHKSIIEQLSRLKLTIMSPQLNTTLSIIERATQSGGDLGRLLESVAVDLRETNKLQKELETSTRGYVYFISFLILFGIPLLLSVASIFINYTSNSAIASGGFSMVLGLSLEQQPQPVQQGPKVGDQIDTIFVTLLAFSAISASLMLGVLWRGEMKAGAKYTLPFVIVSILIYYGMKGAVGSVMKSMGAF